MQVNFEIDGIPEVIFEHMAEKAAFEKWINGALPKNVTIKLPFKRKSGHCQEGVYYVDDALEL